MLKKMGTKGEIRNQTLQTGHIKLHGPKPTAATGEVANGSGDIATSEVTPIVCSWSTYILGSWSARIAESRAEQKRTIV